jgi:hypothetical protein
MTVSVYCHPVLGGESNVCYSGTKVQSKLLQSSYPSIL